jgi:hypothetical protein
MLHQNPLPEKNVSCFERVFKTMKISKILRAAGIDKCCGYTARSLFVIIFNLTFQGKTLTRFLSSERGEDLPKKDAYYRLLKNPKHSWRKFLYALVVRIVDTFEPLTSANRTRVFILDDSVYSRNRSKKTELLAWIFDHTKGHCIKGLNMLTLGWSDGFSFVPVDFTLLSSASESSRLVDINQDIDKRTVGYKRRIEALRKKPDVSVSLIDNALAAGISADYVLFDSWFTNEPMLLALKVRELDVIGMVKNNKQKYTYRGESLDLKAIYSRLPIRKKGSEIIGSVVVHTKKGIPVRLVFVQNRNKRSEWLAVLSTDIAVSDEEIIRIYGMRWSIEVFFKSAKSLLNLGKEFHCNNYDSIVAHTAIVFSRYLLIEWERRHHQDDKTLGGLFFMFCDEVRDMDLKTALLQLMEFFVQLKNLIPNAKDKDLIKQVSLWMDSQPSYIKALMPDFCCET